MGSYILAMLALDLVVGTVSGCRCVFEHQNRTNWGGNVVFSAECLQVAASVQTIRTLVRFDEKVEELHSYK